MLTKKLSGFFVGDNSVAQSAALSIEAKGLYFYLVSLPDGWEFSVERVARALNLGKERCRRFLKELEAINLLKRVQNSDEKGKFGASKWELYDTVSLEGKNGDNEIKNVVNVPYKKQTKTEQSPTNAPSYPFPENPTDGLPADGFHGGRVLGRLINKEPTKKEIYKKINYNPPIAPQRGAAQACAREASANRAQECQNELSAQKQKHGDRLNLAAISEFLAYREAGRKKPTANSVAKWAEFLARYSLQAQSVIVQTSIRNDWQGLFEPPKNYQQPPNNEGARLGNREAQRALGEMLDAAIKNRASRDSP